MTWDPQKYNDFKDQRMLPLLDLLKKIEGQSFKNIMDLGCGTGIATSHLQNRWPNANILGLDSSKSMLKVAKKNYPKSSFIHQNINDWSPLSDFDLIFSNAALHWVKNHELLIPKLMSHLNPKGVLAIQIPNNWEAPSHKIMLKMAEKSEFSKKTLPHIIRNQEFEKDNYFTLLNNLSSDLDIFEKIYTHPLEGEDPIYNWLLGSSLKPLLEALNEQERKIFNTEIKEKFNQGYPSEKGKTIYKFKRLFIIATKP